MLKKIVGLTAVVMIAGAGWAAAPAHAQACDRYSSANCFINEQQANDPGYQRAIHSGYGWNSNGWGSQGSSYGYQNRPYYQPQVYQGYQPPNYYYDYDYKYGQYGYQDYSYRTNKPYKQYWGGYRSY